MKVFRLKIWEQNISKTRKSRNKLQKSFMRIVESKKTCQVSGKGHEDKNVIQTKKIRVITPELMMILRGAIRTIQRKNIYSTKDTS